MPWVGGEVATAVRGGEARQEPDQILRRRKSRQILDTGIGGHGIAVCASNGPAESKAKQGKAESSYQHPHHIPDGLVGLHFGLYFSFQILSHTQTVSLGHTC